MSDSGASRTWSPGWTPATGFHRSRASWQRSPAGELFVPIDRTEQLGPHEVRTSTTKLDLAQFERRPGEILLRADLLDRKLINVGTARLVTAHEVELVCENGVWRVAGC